MPSVDGCEDDLTHFKDVLDQMSDTLNEGHIEDDQSGVFRRDKWDLLAKVGLTGVCAPTEFDGVGLNPLDTVKVLEHLGVVGRDSGLAFSLTTHLASTVTSLTRFGSPELKAQYLPGLAAGELIGAHAISEPEAGSDAMGMSTSVTQHRNGWTLTGDKAFVSNGPVADVIIVYARTGKPRASDSISTFLVPTSAPGVTIGQEVKKMGLRSSPLCSVSLDHVNVPEGNMLGRPGAGLLVLDYVMKREILYSFAVNVGEAGHRLDVAREYANARQQFGKPLANNQAVSHSIVEMLLGYETSRLWLHSTAEKMARGRDVTTDIALTKLVISEASVDSAMRALRLHGGYGFTTEYGLEKDVRSSIAGTIYSGSNEVQRNRAAALMGLKVS